MDENKLLLKEIHEALIKIYDISWGPWKSDVDARTIAKEYIDKIKMELSKEQ